MSAMPAHPTAALSREAVFRAVADPTRRRVLGLLADGERSAGELHGPFTISQPALSRHLRVLREAGLVSERRLGRQRIYSLRAEPLRAVHDWVSHYERFWLERLERLGAYLDRNAVRQPDAAGRRKAGRPGTTGNGPKRGRA